MAVRAPPLRPALHPDRSSWLNLVERWFAELTNKKLRRGAHRSVRELNADIRAWIETWNEDPKPYVWTKTADQILESIASYCTPNQRITTLDRVVVRLVDAREKALELGEAEVAVETCAFERGCPARQGGVEDARAVRALRFLPVTCTMHS